jgi:hypothetical protein
MPFHLRRHCDFDRPGTSKAIAAHLLPPTRTALASLLSSSDVQTPVRLFEAILRSKRACHLPPTLLFCSTQNERGNCDPILVTARFYCILQLDVFICCLATLASTHCAYVGDQCIMPNPTTLFYRSTRNERGSCNPIYPLLLAVLLLARIRNCTSQLCVFV